MSKDDNQSQEQADKATEGARCEDDMEAIRQSGSTFAGNEQEAFHCVSIIGQVEGHYILDGTQKTTKYDHLIPLLIALEESSRVDGIMIVLNTMGGDVEAGLAIAEVIASMTKPTVSVVLGGGHSIGVPLAVSAKRSFIVPSATMTIHPVRTTGVVLSTRQSFDYLRKMQDRILRFIVSHSKVKPERLESMMLNADQLACDIGTILDGEEAVACGLIDQVGGIKEAIAELRRQANELGVREENRRRQEE